MLWTKAANIESSFTAFLHELFGWEWNRMTESDRNLCVRRRDRSVEEFQQMHSLDQLSVRSAGSCVLREALRRQPSTYIGARTELSLKSVVSRRSMLCFSSTNSSKNANVYCDSLNNDRKRRRGTQTAWEGDGIPLRRLLQLLVAAQLSF